MYIESQFMDLVRRMTLKYKNGSHTRRMIYDSNAISWHVIMERFGLVNAKNPGMWVTKAPLAFLH